MQQKIIFLTIIALLLTGCYVDVDYQQELEFQLQPSGVSYQTNINVIVTADDIKKNLSEGGYSIDSFDSLVIDVATLRSDSQRPFAQGEITSLDFLISDDDSTNLLFIFQPALPVDASLDSIFCDFNEDILLDYYKHTPFAVKGTFAGKSTAGGLLILKISGHIKLSRY